MVLACAVIAIVFLWSIVAQRVARIRGLFDGGREVGASVRKVKRYRTGTKLTLEFEVNGIPYKVNFAFQRSFQTPQFEEGMRITVLVDPAHPKRVIPLSLYGDPAAPQTGERPTLTDHRS